MDQRYHDYINSSQRWQCIRALVLLRDRGACRLCGASRRLHVHHCHYDTLYRETGTELITLCDPCHERCHKVGRIECEGHERRPVLRYPEQLDDPSPQRLLAIAQQCLEAW